MATKKFKCKVCGYVHEGEKAPAECPVCKAPASEFEEMKTTKKGFDTNSNTYTIAYASIMVIIVAFLLAFVSSILKPMQDKNIVLDTKKQILAALNIKDVENVEQAYQQYVKSDMLMQEDGSLSENKNGFKTSYKSEIEQNAFHVFVCEVNGKQQYVIPVYGAGLWGAIWGYVALNEDKNTVVGVNFSHASETPGLGAEIATEKFQALFAGKKALNGKEIALGVEKNGKVNQPEYQVDGISGGTITSKGVDAMLKDCLKQYTRFLTK